MTNEEFAILKQNQREAQGLPLRTKRAVTMGEAELERTCTNMLVLDGWRALKTNPVSRRARGAGFGELGMADYLYIRKHFRNGFQPGFLCLTNPDPAILLAPEFPKDLLLWDKHPTG